MTAGQPPAPPSLELLLFRAGGIRFGVECARVAGILTPEEATVRGMAPFDAEPALGLPCRESPPPSCCRVILLKGGETVSGVRIEGPDEFVLVGAGQISPLPALLAATITVPAIRAVALIDQQFILLADFTRVIPPAAGRQKPTETDPEREVTPCSKK